MNALETFQKLRYNVEDFKNENIVFTHAYYDKAIVFDTDRKEIYVMKRSAYIKMKEHLGKIPKQDIWAIDRGELKAIIKQTIEFGWVNIDII